MDSVNGDGGIERQRQTEKPKQQAKPDARAAFQKATHGERDKKGPDEHDRRDRIPLYFG